MKFGSFGAYSFMREDRKKFCVFFFYKKKFLFSSSISMKDFSHIIIIIVMMMVFDIFFIYIHRKSLTPEKTAYTQKNDNKSMN